MPTLALWQWILGAVCALFVGMAKTGVPGLGILVVPLMAQVVGSAKQSAGWLVPMLVVADIFAVTYYRRHAQLRTLSSLVPWVLIGMAGGAVALAASEGSLKRVVGAIVLLMLLLHLRRRLSTKEVAPPSKAASLAFGLTAGFATTVANAAGPVMNVFLLGQRLPKDEFIGTGAWFFLVINLAKVPLLGFHGLVTLPSLLFDLVLLPVVVVGALVGRALFAVLPQRQFEILVWALTAAATVPLLWG